MSPLLTILSTGGTIACREDPELGTVPALTGQDLVAATPGLNRVADIEVENFSNIPSDYMGPVEWIRLARRVAELQEDPRVDGIVITHGTDTLEETAFFIDLVTKGDKPVVFCGAQRAASVWDSDGPRNLLAAARTAASPAARGLGALVVLGGVINAARDVSKVHTSSVEAFGSGGHGALGLVDDGRIIISRRPLRRNLLPLGDALPRVDIIPMYAGADGVPIRAALAAGTGGLVLQALGRGNVNEALYMGAVEAMSRNVPVVVSTRVPGGRTVPVYDFQGGGKTLEAAGAIFAGDLNPYKARVLLMVAAGVSRSPARLRAVFRRFDYGEDSELEPRDLDSQPYRV